MTATAATAVRRPAVGARRSPTWILTDSITVAWRNMLAVVRNPQLLVVDTITPIMFVLLFAVVFGGAIQTPGVSYITFLMPGIFVQTVVSARSPWRRRRSSSGRPSRTSCGTPTPS
jgi:ABC-2 type transport system permease protein